MSNIIFTSTSSSMSASSLARQLGHILFELQDYDRLRSTCPKLADSRFIIDRILTKTLSLEARIDQLQGELLMWKEALQTTISENLILLKAIELSNCPSPVGHDLSIPPSPVERPDSPDPTDSTTETGFAVVVLNGSKSLFNPSHYTAGRAGGSFVASGLYQAVVSSIGVKHLLGSSKSISHVPKAAHLGRNTESRSKRQYEILPGFFLPKVHRSHSNKALDVYVMVLYDLETLEHALLTYPILSIPDGKEQLRAFLKGVNDQAEAAMLGCTALDEVVRKIDDTISFLGRLEHCKLVIVAPDQAEHALQILEQTGGLQAAGKLAVIQDASPGDDTSIIGNARIILTKNIFAQRDELLGSSCSSSQTSIPPEIPTHEANQASSLGMLRKILNGQSETNDPFLPCATPSTVIPNLIAKPFLLKKIPAAKTPSENIAKPHTLASSTVTLPLLSREPLKAIKAERERVTEDSLSFLATSDAPDSPVSIKSVTSTSSSRDSSQTWSSWAYQSTNSSINSVEIVPEEEEEGNIVTSAPDTPCKSRIGKTGMIGPTVYGGLPLSGGSAKSKLTPVAFRIPDRAKAFSQQSPVPPCNRHYLLESGCQDMHCGYGHDFLLTSEEIVELGCDAKKSPSAYLVRGRVCPEGPDKCHMGHSCPYGKDCKYGDSCKFTLDNMHAALATLAAPRIKPSPRSLRLTGHSNTRDSGRRGYRDTISPKAINTISSKEESTCFGDIGNVNTYTRWKPIRGPARKASHPISETSLNRQ